MDTSFKPPGTILRRQNIRMNHRNTAESWDRSYYERGNGAKIRERSEVRNGRRGIRLRISTHAHTHAHTLTEIWVLWDNANAVTAVWWEKFHVSHYWTLPHRYVDPIQGTNNENKAAGTSYPNALVPGGGWQTKSVLVGSINRKEHKGLTQQTRLLTCTS